LCYEVQGTGSPVLLIHGLAASARYWRRTIGHLAQHFRVYAVDVPGFGASRLAGPFSIDAATRIVAEWAHHMALAPVDVVGHSLGGRIAAGLAVDHPGLLRRLVLADAPAWALNAGPVELARRYAAMARYLPLGLVPRIALDSWRAGLATLIRASRLLLETDMPQALERIRAPTLLVWGEQDHLVPLAMGEALARRIPDALLTVIPRAAHNVMWNQPAAFNRTVTDFLQHDRGSGIGNREQTERNGMMGEQ